MEKIVKTAILLAIPDNSLLERTNSLTTLFVKCSGVGRSRTKSKAWIKLQHRFLMESIVYRWYRRWWFCKKNRHLDHPTSQDPSFLLK